MGAKRVELPERRGHGARSFWPSLLWCVLLLSCLAAAFFHRAAFSIGLPQRGDWNLHLALTGDPTEMIVQWKARGPGGWVEYGRTGTPRRLIAWASCQTYAMSDYKCCSAKKCTGEIQDPGQLCEALLTGLVPDASHEYQVKEWEGFLNRTQGSEVVRFRAAPLVHPEYSFQFVVYGDQGAEQNKRSQDRSPREVAALVEKSVRQGARMTHHMGDLSYAVTKTPSSAWTSVWESWLSTIEPYAKQSPYMIGIGNHDLTYECGVPVKKRFHMPAERSKGNGIFWHSYDFGSLHTIVLSSANKLNKGSKQWEWLAQDLRTVNRTSTPWLIVEIHYPIYYRGHKWSLAAQESLEDLLVEHRVDLVLAGHIHAYLRFSRIYKDRKDERGPYYFIVGSAGKSPGNDGGFGKDCYDCKDWYEFSTKDTGFGQITIANSTAMKWEFVHVSGVVVDSLWIVKSPGRRG